MNNTSRGVISMNDKNGGKERLYQKAIQHAASDNANFSKLAADLAKAGRNFYLHRWVLGTSGNFSAVTSLEPLRLVISSTGLDKRSLTPAQFLEIDENNNIIKGEGYPSAEALLHITIVRCMNAAAVLHTHSVWSTVLSSTHVSNGGITLEGYEMLKGLERVHTYEHREWLPILENSTDMIELSQRVCTTLQDSSDIHGFLLRGHGLYTWGANVHQARRHIEILEFLMEVLVRSAEYSRHDGEDYRSSGSRRRRSLWL
jgi:methylthioribulose-1-phosphate dehydratase